MCSIVEGLERGLSMGAAACLNKPVTRDELLSALDKAKPAAGAASLPGKTGRDLKN